MTAPKKDDQHKQNPEKLELAKAIAEQSQKVIKTYTSIESMFMRFGKFLVHGLIVSFSTKEMVKSFP